MINTIVNESSGISKILHELEIPQAPKISVVGMASSGKSSLANALFDNPIAYVKKALIQATVRYDEEADTIHNLIKQGQ